LKRIAPTFLAATLALSLIACSGGSGGLGAVPTVLPTPSSEPTGTDLAPSSVPGASATTSPSEGPGSSASVAPSTAPSAAPTVILRVYFVLGGQPGSEGLVPVLRELPQTTLTATASVKALFAGPTTAEAGDRTIGTAIPSGTRLLGLTVKNSIATVNVSTEFDSGAGTASMQYRLAQVVYTLTQFSTVKSVLFQIEGQTVTVFGSEGIVLAGPVGRSDYEGQLPAIFVDRPANGAALGNPGRVSGSANVFEATFRLAVIDATGKTLVDQQAMASSGSGTRGTFDLTLKYTLAKAQWGILRAYDASAKDGSPENVREYPVWLTPGP
jgi:spore germination protein GerM